MGKTAEKLAHQKIWILFQLVSSPLHFKHQEYMNVIGSLRLSLHLLDGNTAPKGLDTDSEKG